MNNKHIRNKEYFKLALVIVVVLLFLVLRGHGARTLILYLQKESENKVNIVDLWNNEEYNRVLNLSEAALQKNPLDPDALLFMGLSSFNIATYSGNLVEEQFGFIENAVFYLRRFLNVSKSKKYQAEANYVLAKAYHHRDPAYANLVVHYLDEAKALGFDSRVMDEYYGLAYIQLGQYDKGIAYFLKAEEGGRNASFFFNLAEAYNLAGKMKEAETYYNRVMAITKNDALGDQAKYQLALLYLNHGFYLDSTLLFKSYLEHYPDNANAHFNLGEAYYFLGRLAEARTEWQITTRLDYSNDVAIARLLS